MAIILFNIWAAAVISLVVVMITVEVYGFMGLAGIKLSAFPAVRVIFSVGVCMEFTLHISMVCCLYFVIKFFSIECIVQNWKFIGLGGNRNYKTFLPGINM